MYLIQSPDYHFLYKYLRIFDFGMIIIELEVFSEKKKYDYHFLYKKHT